MKEMHPWGRFAMLAALSLTFLLPTTSAHSFDIPRAQSNAHPGLSSEPGFAFEERSLLQPSQLQSRASLAGLPADSKLRFVYTTYALLRDVTPAAGLLAALYKLAITIASSPVPPAVTRFKGQLDNAIEFSMGNLGLQFVDASGEGDVGGDDGDGKLRARLAPTVLAFSRWMLGKVEGGWATLFEGVVDGVEEVEGGRVVVSVKVYGAVDEVDE